MKSQEATPGPTVLPQYFRDAVRTRYSAEALLRLETVFALRAAPLQITNVLNEWLEGTAGSQARFQTLAMLWAAGDRLVPHQEIISVLQVKRATVSALMYSLEQEGLVRSVGDQQDRRRLLATVTEQGKKVITSAMEINQGRVKKALAGFSPEELITLQNLLSRATEGFQQAVEDEAHS